MNIFVLDLNPELAAQYHCDKHVIKMILETAQIMSTVIQEQKNLEDTIYKATHRNHPCTIWAKQSLANMEWLYLLGKSLCKEYTFRYGKYHKSEGVLDKCNFYMKDLNYPNNTMTQFALAMPEKYRTDNVIESYWNYYLAEKLSNPNLFKYTKRPEIIVEILKRKSNEK
jgi:hypothetical protein